MTVGSRYRSLGITCPAKRCMDRITSACGSAPKFTSKLKYVMPNRSDSIASFSMHSSARPITARVGLHLFHVMRLAVLEEALPILVGHRIAIRLTRQIGRLGERLIAAQRRIGEGRDIGIGLRAVHVIHRHHLLRRRIVPVRAQAVAIHREQCLLFAMIGEEEWRGQQMEAVLAGPAIRRLGAHRRNPDRRGGRCTGLGPSVWPSTVVQRP